MSALLIALLMTGCAATSTSDRPLSDGVAWVAAGEGWADEAQSVYADALSYLESVSAERPAGSWAVVLDVDETVLNNVAYQVRLEQRGESFTPASWTAWTDEESATLVPGVKAFLAAIGRLGGHAALVTNRSDREQLATENNLAALGIRRGEHFRVLLTRARPDGPGEKDERFALVPPMLAAQGYPDVTVIAFVGDNVGDKPANPGGETDAWRFFCIDQGAMYGRPCAEVPGPGR